ncbi:hypothetical protein QBC47DRAFT_48172 [Echria macrotheca]|uniref:SnoaL-like domain-containing protein n=1 Tax=Echria macrotheca TaxID=438768 RepID=A0AAJ0BBQ0_9PEZI|nr:hypothetical protein QBC47DRAFT_48172 [Echria macrotheca]
MSASTLTQTAQRVVDAYNAWSIDQIMAFRSEDCIQEILPTSMNVPPQNNTQHEAHQRMIAPFFTNFHLVVLEQTVDESAKKVTLWAKATADTVVGPYANEYVIALHMNEAGDRVVLVREFVDSGFAGPFFGKLRGHMMAAAGGKGGPAEH